ncbi:hypothetical protein F4810DRAFT_667227 [Camillea tinctor]|nr:hypothetical protein F4810DRAFT_667227 [Camillea tinctor]
MDTLEREREKAGFCCGALGGGLLDKRSSSSWRRESFAALFLCICFLFPGRLAHMGKHLVAFPSGRDCWWRTCLLRHTHIYCYTHIVPIHSLSISLPPSLSLSRICGHKHIHTYIHHSSYTPPRLELSPRFLPKTRNDGGWDKYERKKQQER